MKKNFKLPSMILISCMLLFSCQTKKEADIQKKDDFKYLVEQFADLKIMRFQVPGFDSLSLKQKELIYYLSQAALSGRDIIYDQNYKYNLVIRRTLEGIVDSYRGNRETEDFKKFMVYTKRVWFSNGIHHHYSSDKFTPGFSKEYFAELIKNSNPARLPLKVNQKTDEFVAFLTPILFDPEIAPKKVNLDPSKDLVQASAVNFYENVTASEAEAFYARKKKKDDPEPISYGLNSKLVKENGVLTEKVYKVGGLYSSAIEKIVYWLEKAAGVAENDAQKAVLLKLAEYYKTGDLKTWDQYNVMWVKDMESMVDCVNGFIEVYEDPLAMKATWESVVNFKDLEATKRSVIISSNAQWFEDHSPVDPRYKKKEVKGVSAKVITTAQLGGISYPSTAIGINLPNADWIRKEYGSKSVTMDNITYAYDQAAQGNGFMEEFCYSKEEIEWNKKYGLLAGNLTTDLHECLGHGSGQMAKNVSSEALKNYHSTLEEARADLFALYYIMDQKLVDLKLMPSLDVAKTEYINYLRNGLLTQLTRIKPGKTIEEAHMRNRALVAHWVFEKGMKDKVVEMKKKDGKTYVVVNDYQKLRGLFGELLKEIQRIKSEGDYQAGRKLVEDYGVKVDAALHQEVVERFKKLNLSPYGGFMNPEFVPVMQGDKMVDVKINYPDNYVEQMMKYSKEYSYLPTYN